MKGLLLTVMLVAASAQGQEAAPSAKPALDTVEVYGSNKKLGREVQEFVGSVTQLDGDLVSSWNKPICPAVVANDMAHAEYIRQRLLEVASEIPFDANADPKCRANLFIVVTDAPEEFIAKWKAVDPGMFIWRPRRGVSRSPESLPVRTWHNVAVEPAGDAPSLQVAGAIPSTGGKSSGIGGLPTVRVSGGSSRIVSPASENLQSALVLVDTNKAAGVTLRQLADYVAMVSFSKVDLDADFQQANSILRLFAMEQGAVRPEGLTRWDLAFLRGLYRQSYEAQRQRTAITTRMVRDLTESALAHP